MSGFSSPVVPGWRGRVLVRRPYGIDPADPVTLGAAVAGLSPVAAIAMLIPSMRAARVDPAVVLRVE